MKTILGKIKSLLIKIPGLNNVKWYINIPMIFLYLFLIMCIFLGLKIDEDAVTISDKIYRQIESIFFTFMMFIYPYIVISNIFGLRQKIIGRFNNSIIKASCKIGLLWFGLFLVYGILYQPTYSEEYSLILEERQEIRLEEKKKQEELAKAEEEKKKQEELAKAEEEKKKQEELAKAEEEKKKQEELAKAEEEKKKQEELAKAEEEKKKQEELAKAEEDSDILDSFKPAVGNIFPNVKLYAKEDNQMVHYFTVLETGKNVVASNGYIIEDAIKVKDAFTGEEYWKDREKMLLLQYQLTGEYMYYVAENDPNLK